jgi:hypothetical protein
MERGICQVESTFGGGLDLLAVALHCHQSTIGSGLDVIAALQLRSNLHHTLSRTYLAALLHDGTACRGHSHESICRSGSVSPRTRHKN